MLELCCDNIYSLAEVDGQFCSVSDRADTTVLAIMCWNNQQKEQMKIHLIVLFLSCKSERNFRVALNKTDVCVANCNLTVKEAK